VTKSFTSTAIAFGRRGQAELDDFICDYFPEKMPAGGAHPYTRMMTIRNLLTMSTVHEKTA
jgi:CubicO group peptidase (beta-lactamase class C family)